MKEHTGTTCCISNGAFIAMCCIPTFIDVIDLLVKASFPQGWHPHLGKKKAEGSNARGVCVLSVVEKCVCVNLSSHEHMNEQTSKFRLPVDANKESFF